MHIAWVLDRKNINFLYYHSGLCSKFVITVRVSIQSGATIRTNMVDKEMSDLLAWLATRVALIDVKLGLM